MPTNTVAVSILAFTLSLLLLSPPTFAQEHGNSVPIVNPQAEKLTQSLVELSARYQRAATVEQERLFNQLLDAVADRQKLLTELVEANPGAVLRVALPEKVRRNMPIEVQVFLEQDKQIDGKLEVLVEDYGHEARFRYFLDVGAARLSLHFKADPPRLQSGTRVRVRGIRLDGAMAVESGEESVSVLGDASGTQALVSGSTFGEQRTVVLLVNFKDDSSEPYTVDQARTIVLGDTSDFFLENSFQQTWLSGDVYGWYTLSINSTCSTSEISNAADAAASVNLSNYNRIVYVFPHNSSCGWDGIATVGGNPSRSWINWFDLHTVSHEMGHNFGLYHSNALDCGNAPLGNNCTVKEYGDRVDTMGSTAAGHFNAFQKERLGWLDYGDSPPITHVGSDGNYLIEAYETQTGAAKAVKIPRSTDPSTGRTSWFYLEYRQPIGFDSFLAKWSDSTYRGDVTDGVFVRLGEEGNGRSSQVLHMKPDSLWYQTFGWLDWHDPALATGDSFTDAESGVTITPLWADGSQLQVSVSVTGGTPCVRANPSVTLSPGESQWVTPGTAVVYTVQVTNRDSSGCSSSAFNLLADVPSGWTAAFGKASLSLQPGASASTSLEVASSSATADGFYTVTALAENADTPGYGDSDSVTYVVSADGANGAPVAIADSATTLQGTAVTIEVLANDWDPDNDPLDVTGVTQGSKGQVVINADASLTYTPNPKARGSDSFVYTITDGKASASASVTVQLQRQTGGSKGGGKGR